MGVSWKLGGHSLRLYDRNQRDPAIKPGGGRDLTPESSPLLSPGLHGMCVSTFPHSHTHTSNNRVNKNNNAYLSMNA